jgi:hypothetical protein
MRLLVLATLCLVAVGCGEQDELGESGACASGIVLNGDLYVGMAIPGPDPKAGPPVDGGIEPACNDSGPPFESDREIGLREVPGVPPEVAVYPEWEISTTYVNAGYRTELPSHPLHDRIHGSGDRPRHRPRGRRCRLDGEVVSMFAPAIRTGDRRLGFSVDVRTRIDGFDRGGLPYLKRGDRVRIHGYGCDRDWMLARRIEPQP